MSLGDSSSSRSFALTLLAGVSIGSALALGSAFLVARHYAYSNQHGYGAKRVKGCRSSVSQRLSHIKVISSIPRQASHARAPSSTVEGMSEDELSLSLSPGRSDNLNVRDEAVGEGQQFAYFGPGEGYRASSTNLDGSSPSGSEALNRESYPGGGSEDGDHVAHHRESMYGYSPLPSAARLQGSMAPHLISPKESPISQAAASRQQGGPQSAGQLHVLAHSSLPSISAIPPLVSEALQSPVKRHQSPTAHSSTFDKITSLTSLPHKTNSGGGAASRTTSTLVASMSALAPPLNLNAIAASAGVSLQPPAHSGSNDDDFIRVITPEAEMNEEVEDVCRMMSEMLEMRSKWLFKNAAGPEYKRGEPEAAVPSEIRPNPLEYNPQPPSAHTYKMVDGVMRVYEGQDQTVEAFPLPGNAIQFYHDMNRILKYSAMGPVKSFCHHRLVLLEQKFNLHVMLNSDKEYLAQKVAPHRDFYNVRKVDTHIHHSACMHQKHLLRFIKSKLRKEPDEVVIFRDGKYLTLKEVFESLKLTGYDLNVDTLDMHADKSLFHRFDRFNLKYNPCGQSRLREIFIKQDNLIHGRFLAELTKEVFSDLEASKYQHAELRISIYGRKAMEWDILASWVVSNDVYSDNNVWLIQIPRLYNIYKETGVIDNFQTMIDNIFEPLFEVTRDPASHPQLHVLLSQVVGFDMVDDESKPERRPTKHTPPPTEWNSKHNAAYAYYAYYIYANLYTLNKLRESRGMNTFSFRPHSGEAGDIDHLVSTFLLSENIAHGINLRKSPCLQYLYYLAQIGLCMSPLSNNSLFLDYHRNPLPQFFAHGLSVSLSTDDPLQIHLTKEPLVEEYSVAAQVWKLSSTDLCEIARNGVLHSGFPHSCKKHWVSGEYWKPGPEGNDIHKTNVPNLRLRFRHETYTGELQLLLSGLLKWRARVAARQPRD